MASSSSSNSALIQQLDQKSRDLTAKIVAHLKSQGNFDELRRDCLEELDKMEAFRQLNQRVESYVATFLSKQEWSESLSKNQIRDNLRKHVCASDALKSGAQRLVSQVLEKKSKSFQTRLEGVVQNYIYMEKEKPQHSRYQNRSEHSRAFDKSEAVKTSTTGKTSETISDIDDIISQISGPKESPPMTKIEGSAFMKSESKEVVHSSTSMHHRSDSSLSKQQAAGSLPKSESSRLERKGDSSPIDVPKSTPSKTIMGAKKFNPSKRVTPKTTFSQSTGNASEKNADSSINARTKTIHCKPSSSPKSHSPKVESPRDSTDIEKPATKVPENVASLKADIHRTSPLSNVSKGLHEKIKCSEVVVGLHARQKVEDKYIDSSKSVQESIKPVEVESKVEEKPSVETHLKKDLQEKKPKDLPLVEPQVELSTTGVASPGDDDVKDMKNKHNLPEDLESDIESDVSDVSSVHTSDLSSFDGEISSDSYNNSDDDDDTKKGTERGTSKSEGESKRKWVHSPGSGKGESTRERKNMNRFVESKGTKMQSQMQKSGTSTADTTTRRKRGRPRKDRSETENRQRRDLKQDRSKQQHEELADRESSDGMPTRDRSKRPIKKRRCYSPSSEGSREVCLPSKRSRVSSKD